MKQSLAPILAVAVMLTCVSGALAQDIDAVRKDFDRTTGAALAQVQDMAAVEDVTSRLPGNRTLRQTVKLFAKNGKIRQEVEAIMKNGSRIKFLTIMADDEMWTLTPNGKMVKMEMAAHGGMRPDPLMKYLSISIKPGAKMAGKETWEGKDALVVDNGDGERLWLEAKSMIPLKLETLLPMEGKVEWIFHESKLVNGVAAFPYDIKYSSDSAVFFHHVMLIAVNAGLEDDLFNPQAVIGSPAQ